MFEFLKLLPLTGRMADCWFTQGDCPGLGASAPSGRVGHGLCFLLNYHFPKKAPIFPKYSRFSGKVWEKLAAK